MSFAALIPIIAGVGGSILASKLASGGSKQALSSPPPLPKAPEPADSADKAQETIRRKRANLTKSIYTSPLGVGGEAQVARKTLLGQ